MYTNNTSLQSLNTFAVPCVANNFITISHIEQLYKLVDEFEAQLKDKAFYLLGEGSNTLFIDDHVNLVIKCNLMGIDITESDDFFYVKAAAAENWHELVSSCLAKDIFGLENLALIPGSVGAAPVQNIGAYGIEVADFCHSIEWFDFTNRGLRDIPANECNFAYRESVFKQALKDKGIITAVTFKIPKVWQPRLAYQGLTDLPISSTPLEVFNKVIELRQSKLPDPLKIPNAGSFFKNPIVTQVEFQQLKAEYHQIPFYLQNDNTVKLAAGWLIEESGFKGKQHITASVHKKQALVIVNEFCGSGKNIVNLAKAITDGVYNKFAIRLEPEVRFIGINGEVSSTHFIQTLY